MMMTLANYVYEDSEDRTAAVKIVKEIVAAGRRNPAAAPQPPPAAAPNNKQQQGTTFDKLAHNVAMRLRNNEKKFSGDTSECWQEYVDEYSQVSRHYSLSPPKSSNSCTSCFRGMPSGITLILSLDMQLPFSKL